ncbi:MAG: SusC/RagA family TonB-linked outer membrane protein [Bacteroidales bacterium]|jgi:iron complex outermembrane receptor protein|nr:SusC/RagA family TonB-linked outer membrane protein [Bacteroidales bacterium]
MRKALLYFPILLLFVFNASAQDITVTGKLTDADDELGMPGVTVMVKGSTRGVVTDMDGYYSLTDVRATDTLVFRFLGYEQQEIAVGDQKVINVVMVPTAEMLDEVIVTALGVKRQKRDIGYSTEKIEADLIVRSNAPNVINAITGRAAGVQVSQGDGVDGGSTRITIRGNNSLMGNNQPLIVVDNVPMENTPGFENIGRGVDWGNPLGDINSHDIEDYTVLKGGAASALYGSRGANGVILITTKRGAKRKGIGVNYNYTYKVIQPYRFREMQNKYGAGGPVSFTPPSFPMDGDTLLYPGIYGNDHLVINQDGDVSSTTAEFGYYGSAVSWGPEMQGQNVRWWDGRMRAYSPQADNYESAFRTGSTQTHNISASGGGDIGSIRVSLTRQDHEPIVENSSFDRTTINLGANLNISDALRADLTLTYSRFNRMNSPTLGDEWNTSFNKGYLYSWPRSYQNIDRENYELADGSRNPQEGYPFQYVSPYLWWNYYNWNTTLNRDKYLGAITLTYDVTPWMSLMGRIGRDFTMEQYETTHKPVDVIGLQDGYYSNSLNKTYSDIFELYLKLFKDELFTPKLNVDFTLGASQWDYSLYGINGHSGTWYYPNMYFFGNYTETTYGTDSLGNTIIEDLGNSASDMVPGEQVSRERNNSIFGFLNLSYGNFLFVELTGRNDWSSTLPEDNNSYFYPSISVSLIASELIDMQGKLPWLNFVKLRGGVAQTATDTRPYQIDFYYNTDIFGGQQSTSFPAVIPPFELTPQRVNAYEGGLVLGFFENRIDFDFTYYYMHSFSQILEDLPVPVSSGASGITINEGVLTNQGFEIILNAVPIYNRNVIFKTGINFSRNRNKVESLGDNAQILPIGDIWGLNGPEMALREGDEYGTIYGYDYVYHENGQPILNDDGTTYKITDTRVPIGNASPDFLAGWHTELHWKGFTLGTLIDTKWGGDIYCGSYVINLQCGLSPETLEERDGGGLPYTDPDGNTSNIGVILPGVYEDGTPNDKVVHYYYKYLPNAGGWGKFLSTPGILENSWVKMREISLSYTFPQKIVRKAKIFQGLTLSIVGRDLFYIYSSLPDKINPEGIMGQGNAQGFEWASMPSSRSVSFGISASF